MNLKALLLAGTTSHLRFKAPEGEGAGGGGTATGTEVGGTQRVTVGNDGSADAEATARSGASGAEAPVRPEGLPEGFDSVEAFVAAVNDGTYTPPAAEGSETKTGTEPSALDPEVAKAFEDPRIQPFAAEFTEKGDLAPESITKLAADLNIPEAIIRTYVDSVKAGTAAAVTVESAPFHQAAGGADQWGAFQVWTTEGNNLPPATEKAYRALLDQGKTAEALAVLQPSISAWKAAGGGKAPRDVTGEGSGGKGGDANAGDVYESWAQLQADQGTDQYRNDPAFREMVYAKLSRSKL